MEKTHWKKLDNPNYLGAYSFMDGTEKEKKDHVFTIAKVSMEEVENERGKEQCKVMHLKGSKPMILNATNSKAISKALDTPYIEEWVGRNITLFVVKKKIFGELMDVLRVRPTSPNVKKEELTPKHPSWEQAKKGLNAKNVTLSQIQAKYSINQENIDLLCLG